CLFLILPPPPSTLFPYTTLFRSPRNAAHQSIAVLVNSGPLSLTMVSTFPRSAMSLSSMRATRAPDSEKSTSTARHSRVKSSTRVRIRKRRPFAKASVMKSIDQRSFGWLGGGGTLRSEAATRFRFGLRTTRFLRVGIRPPLLAVQAIDPLVVYPVASPPKQSMEPSVPEPRTLGRNLAKFL